MARLLTLAADGGASCYWSDLYTGRNGLAGKSALAELSDAHGAELTRLPLYLDTDQGADGWAYTKLEQAVIELRAAHPDDPGRPVLLVVDFLQLVAGAGGREELRERIGRAAYAAREAARKHNAVILVLSSTARENYKTLAVEIGTDGMPTTPAVALVGLGKESGEVEFAADSVLALCRADSDEGAVWVAVAKQRAGTTGWYRLRTDKGYFSEGTLDRDRFGPPSPAKPADGGKRTATDPVAGQTARAAETKRLAVEARGLATAYAGDDPHEGKRLDGLAKVAEKKAEAERLKLLEKQGARAGNAKPAARSYGGNDDC